MSAETFPGLPVVPAVAMVAMENLDRASAVPMCSECSQPASHPSLAYIFDRRRRRYRLFLPFSPRIHSVGNIRRSCVCANTHDIPDRT